MSNDINPVPAQKQAQDQGVYSYPWDEYEWMSMSEYYKHTNESPSKNGWEFYEGCLRRKKAGKS